MSNSTQLPAASPGRHRGSSWVLARLADRPGHSRKRSVIIIAIVVAVIGWLDYMTGIRVSLELFYLVPITLTVAWLGWRAAGIVSVICILSRVTGDLATGPYNYPLTAFWNRLVDLGMYFVMVWTMHALISLSRELDLRVEERTQALQKAIQERQQLEREMLDIAARERSAIGRELHDDLCQHLVGTAFAAKVLAEHLAASNAPAAAHDAMAIVNYVEEGIAKTRGLARGLLLASIEPAELGNELTNLAAKGGGNGVSCRFRLEGRPFIEDSAAGAQLLRIAQEAMRNALRHADPKHIDIVLAGNDDATFLMVHDDGRGLQPPDARNGGMGLRIMEHRAALIGGTLSVVPAPGEGTRVICHIPRPAAASRA
jgi:signal transduction histidine kinase